MIIKQEFWELIKKNKKTIELRKVSIFNDIIVKILELGNINNGKFKIPLYKNETTYIGKITINGYSVIKNPFQFFINNPNYRNIKNKYDREDTCVYLKSNFGRNLDNQENINNWIYDNLDFLIDYFKDEKEILILNIESWSNSNE